MSLRRSIRLRRGRKKLNDVFELQLTSMLDILVIILVFLLKSYQASTNNFGSVEGIKLPVSKNLNIAQDSLHLIVTPEGMTFENEKIVEFDFKGDLAKDEVVEYEFKRDQLAQRGRRVVPLFDALVKAREKSEILRAQSKARDEEGNPLPFDGVLSVQADKRIRYETLRKIMYTAGEAGYRVFHLLAMKKEE